MSEKEDSASSMILGIAARYPQLEPLCRILVNEIEAQEKAKAAEKAERDMRTQTEDEQA